MDTVWPLRKKRKTKRARREGGGYSPAYCESLASGTGARCRVQVVPCTFSSSFLRAIVLFKRAVKLPKLREGKRFNSRASWRSVGKERRTRVFTSVTVLQYPFTERWISVVQLDNNDRQRKLCWNLHWTSRYRGDMERR